MSLASFNLSLHLSLSLSSWGFISFHLCVSSSRPISISHGNLELEDRTVLKDISQRHHLVYSSGITRRDGVMDRGTHITADCGMLNTTADILLTLLQDSRTRLLRQGLRIFFFEGGLNKDIKSWPV